MQVEPHLIFTCNGCGFYTYLKEYFLQFDKKNTWYCISPG